MTEIVAFLQYYAKKTVMVSVRGTSDPAGQQALIYQWPVCVDDGL